MTGNRLPEGWRRGTLASFVEPRRERVSPADHPGAEYIGLEHVEAHTTRLVGAGSTTDIRSSCGKFGSGDVLYGRLRPYLNKVCHPGRAGYCSPEFIVLCGSGVVESRFVLYRMNSADFVSYASHATEGDRPRVSYEQLGAFLLSLPPLTEQRRIVEKIEELFSQLDAGVAALERVRANLKRYRASVLKAAVEGRLTEEWRRAHPDAEPAAELLKRIRKERREAWERNELAKYEAKGKPPPKNWREKYKEPEPPDTTDLPELPEGWCWASLGETCVIRDDLRRPVNAAERAGRAGPYPYYGATGQVGWIDGYLMDGEYVLLGEDGVAFLDPMKPKAYMVRGKAWVNNHAHVLRGIAGVLDNGFLLHQLNALDYRGHVNGTTRLKLTQGAMVQMRLVVPPVSEQAAIVAEVEARLSVLDALEATVEANLARAGRLRQAVLKRAFEGRLVPQECGTEAADAGRG